jgi:Zn-dependent protease with chaperone function
MIRHRPALPILFLALLLAGCAGGAADSGRTQFLMPPQVAEAFSEMELRAMLALASDASCSEKVCDAQVEFRRHIRQLGGQLSASARQIRKELAGPLPNFIFLVPAKREIGTLSNAAGTIVVFDGVRTLQLEDPVLAFLIAREMGHVIRRHHAENAATGLALSAMTTIAIPVASPSAAASMAGAAASVAGAQVIKSLYRPEQLRAADLTALQIMNQAGWPTAVLAESLQRACDKLQGEGWAGELQTSNALLKNLLGDAPAAAVSGTAAEQEVPPASR